MADTKPIQDNGFNFTSILGVLNIITSAFKIPDTPAEPLPPPLIMTGANLRPGLTPTDLAAQIISKQSDAGRAVGDVFADGPNVEEAMEVIRIQQIIEAILTKARVDVVIPPGIQVTTAGANAAGPVASQGATVGMGIGSGIIR
jgi:hypothetical protein